MNQTGKNIIRRIIQVFITQILQGVILFLAAGTILWTWAWILIALGVAQLIINFFVIPREVIAERGRKKEDAKQWDKVLASVNSIPIILMYVFCGLDFRFGWSGNVNIIINISGLILSFSGSMLFTWAMVANKYFSTLVRLQVDRNHTVATGGPYQFIRHPGYVGYILMSSATPLALGTLWGLLFSAVTGVLLIVRTALEDRTLQKELPGYAEYAARVKYRLLPFIW